MFVVVSYDIVDNKKRNRVADLMLDYGRRVQKSVFECDLNEKDLNNMIQEATELIDSETDSLIIYRLCEDCVPKIQAHGRQTAMKNIMIV